MRRWACFISIVFLINLILFSLEIDFKKFTPEQAANWMEKRLSSCYENINVVAKEEKEGVNFAFNVKKELTSMDDFYDFVMDMVIYVGEITSKTKWRSDKAGVFFKGKLMAWIYTRHCREAIRPERDIGRMDYIISKMHYPEK